jgi:hypothetical protein
MLTAAGLVALLDLAGPDRVGRWAERAEDRYRKTNDRQDVLIAARPHQAGVKRMAAWAASRPPGSESGGDSRPEPGVLEGLTVEDFEAFRLQAWAAIRRDRRYSGASLAFPRFIFPFFEGRAYEFLVPRSATLAAGFEEFRKRKQRWQWMRLVLLGSMLPGTAAVGWWFHSDGMPWLASVVVAYLAVGLVALSASAALLTPRFVTTLLSVAASVRLGLAKAAVRAMGDGKDARPLRVIALGMFIVGSLLDLVAGW